MPAIRTKALSAKIMTTAPEDAATSKALSVLPEDPPGTFVALVSVFGNEDYAGDVVEPGAFAESIKKFESGDVVMAVVWSHDFGRIKSFVGRYSAMEETSEGLLVKGHLDLDTDEGARLYGLMKDKIIVEFSWSGEVLEYEVIEPEDPDDEWAWWFAGIRIQKVDLWEAGPCFKGMNPETQLISVKAADLSGPLAKRILHDSKSRPDFAAPEGKPASEPEPEATAAKAEDLSVDDHVDDTTDVQRDSAATTARALLGLATITQEGRSA